MNLTAPSRNIPAAASASDYQQRYGRSMMVLKKIKGATAAPDELCRITSVNTLAPDLWVTVQFLDGSARGLRPDGICPFETATAVSLGPDVQS
jgi:hypothetical protein